MINLPASTHTVQERREKAPQQPATRNGLKARGTSARSRRGSAPRRADQFQMPPDHERKFRGDGATNRIA